MIIVPFLLTASLSLNIAALFLPFLTVSIFNTPPELIYIPSIIQKMWKHEIYIPAILIFGFSVCFPFIKLYSLYWIYFLPKHNWWSRNYLRVLSYAGRFSLLDIFIELNALILAHGNGTKEIGFGKHKKVITLFVTELHIGLPIYITAIVLNMIASETMCHLERLKPKDEMAEKRYVRPIARVGIVGWIMVPILIAGTGYTLIMSWTQPFLKLTAKYLHNFSYDVITTVEAME